jgi:uncharacterized 2Fe-2S/4Fe-4S cluster protein (DUF4445 family)
LHRRNRLTAALHILETADHQSPPSARARRTMCAAASLGAIVLSVRQESAMRSVKVMVCLRLDGQDISAVLNLTFEKFVVSTMYENAFDLSSNSL